MFEEQNLSVGSVPVLNLDWCSKILNELHREPETYYSEIEKNYQEEEQTLLVDSVSILNLDLCSEVLNKLHQEQETYYPEIEKNYQEEYNPENPWIDGKWIFTDGGKRWTRFLPTKVDKSSTTIKNNNELLAH
jgi:hypothetical protein